MNNSNENILISAVVPVYNSEKIIRVLCPRLNETLAAICGQNYEIILVDDCSTDDVWTIIKEIAKTNTHIKGYRLGNNYGQFMASLAGISKSSGRYIVTIDDDLEYDPADIKKLYEDINAKDRYLVFGIAPAKYRFKNLGTLRAKMRNSFINFMWQKILTDSFKIFKRELLFNGQTFSAKVHFEAFVKHNLNERFVGYTEVSYQRRYAGASNHNLWRKVKILLRYSIEYYRRPLVGIAAFTYLIFLLSLLLEFLVFKGRLNGLLTIATAFTGLTLALLILHYTIHIYREVRNIPDYWIIESTEVPER